jgi:hypothetical protein
MEVHHHSHHPQKWKEYLSEFLMLFFAVFLGFMAEYYLEYRAERHKEHDYLVSMIEDLKSDTTEIGNKFLAMNELIIAGNKLTQIAYKEKWTDADIDSIYLNSILLVTRLVTLNFTTGTVDQLKNAGGFRLIRNTEIVKKINEYEKGKNLIKVQQEGLSEKWYNVHKIQNALLHLNVFTATGKLGQVEYNKLMLDEIFKVTGSKFLKKDRMTFYEYSNYINVMKGYVAFYQNMAMIEKQNGIELIKILEKEID